MKSILFALAFGLMGSISHAQTTQVKIGRHGACSTGRGICGIQTQADAKTTDTNNNNAVFLKSEDGSIILRLYKNKLSQFQIDTLFGKHINPESTTAVLQIDQEFSLDSATKSSLYFTTGIHLNLINAASFEALINEDYIDVILLKSKS